MIYLTRKEHFNAAHKLYNPAWNKERNNAIFGKCANANWHGHNYELWVTIKGNPHKDTGFIMNAKDLSVLIKKHITDILDHRNLNIDITFIPQGTIPSTENLVKLIWKQIEPHIPLPCKLHAVKLQETENIYAEYFGE